MKQNQNNVLTKLRLSKVVATALLFSVCSMVEAQETVVVSGGNASGSGGSISYSVGQTIQNTISGSNGSAIQGIQFYFESETLSIIDLSSNLEISTYPNPTSSILNLKVEGLRNLKLSYKLYNLLGVTLANGSITQINNRINVEDLPSATYILQITDENSTVKTFKITKN